jgi:hypothetical protein
MTSPEFSRVFTKEWWGWSSPEMIVTLWPVSGGTYQVNYRKWVYKSGLTLHAAQKMAAELYEHHMDRALVEGAL